MGCLQAGDPGARDVIQSESKGLRKKCTGVWGHEKMDTPAQKESQFAHPLPFYSIQALCGLDDAHQHQWGPPCSVHRFQHWPLWETPSETQPRHNMLPALWASRVQSRGRRKSALAGIVTPADSWVGFAWEETFETRTGWVESVLEGEQRVRRQCAGCFTRVVWSWQAPLE